MSECAHITFDLYGINHYVHIRYIYKQVKVKLTTCGFFFLTLQINDDGKSKRMKLQSNNEKINCSLQNKMKANWIICSMYCKKCCL